MGSVLNVAVLVGNGFDLSLGMNTTAQFFLNDLIEEVTISGRLDTPEGRLVKRISDEGVECWSDFERKIGEYAAYLEQTVEEASLAEEYMEAKGAIDKALQQRIATEENRVSDVFIRENAQNCIASLTEWHDYLRPEENRSLAAPYTAPLSYKYDLVCFNYTATLERMCKQVAGNSSETTWNHDLDSVHTLKRLYYAHGTLTDVPICGVDNVNQIQCNTLRGEEGVVSTVVKPAIQEMFATDAARNALGAIARAHVILVYGMSLGETDSRWWAAVAENLRSYTNRFLVIYSRKAGTIDTPIAYYQLTSGIKQRFFSAAGIVDEAVKKKLQSRIFIVSSDNLFPVTKTLNSVEPAEVDSQ